MPKQTVTLTMEPWLVEKATAFAEEISLSLSAFTSMVLAKAIGGKSGSFKETTDGEKNYAPAT